MNADVYRAKNLVIDQENWWCLDSSPILACPAYEAKVQFILQTADFQAAVLAAEIWQTNTLAGHGHTSIKHALNPIKCDASVMYKRYLLMSWCVHTVHNLTPCHAWYITKWKKRRRRKSTSHKLRLLLIQSKLKIRWVGNCGSSCTFHLLLPVLSQFFDDLSSCKQ